MTRLARAALHFTAALQFALAGGCLFYLAVFLIGGSTNDELGLSKALQMPFIVVCAIGAGLLTYGGIRTWRMDRRWWWPAVVAVLGIPVLFVVLFAISGT